VLVNKYQSYKSKVKAEHFRPISVLNYRPRITTSPNANIKQINTCCGLQHNVHQTVADVRQCCPFECHLPVKA